MIELILFGTFAVLLFVGVPVAFALGLSAAVALIAVGGLGDLSLVPSVFVGSVSSETLLAIPFFILAGVIMEYAGISRRLIDFANACVGHRKHGLAIVVIIAAFFFSAISGSGPATVAAIGTILIPALIRHGYQKRHATSLVASAGSLGIIVPPSIVFIIFAVVVSDYAGVSIVRLFVAGIVPGIMLAVALMVACLFLPRATATVSAMVNGRRAAAQDPGDGDARVEATVGAGSNAEGGTAGTEAGSAFVGTESSPVTDAADAEVAAGVGRRASTRDLASAFLRALPGLLMPVIILGGIYGGVVTPTESAVVACAYAMLVGLFLYRELKLSSLYRIFVTAAAQSAVIMLIVGSASVFTYVVTVNHIAAHLADLLLSFTENRFLIVLLVMILLLIIGAFIDAVSALYLFVPIVAPVLLAVGVDVTTIGVLMTVNLALGLVTPPVGVNLFVAAGIARVPLVEVIRGTGPFLLAGLAVLFLVAYVPEFSNWLPDLLGF
ncbi:TRAP transporter large permease [Spiractinospora alimapuensis]|uniref:TRAP transporter large permease n=1 Tax=Spiractinospora alimapuensis TaxID=2820884 RepID=UPI001F3BD5A7|nr:TRAP transporter large permease [Spiractinospora alimapuensis]QVQ51421.1 TRAP transporter large permease [Spiractinospora alimapuensis]